MSSIIGQLRVILGLETAAFEAGAKRAEVRAKAVGNEAEALGNKVGTMGKAMIAAGAAFAASAFAQQIAQLVKQGLDYASALGETAQQLGVSTRALQEYRYAATQAGIEQGEMDAALAKLTRTMGEAAGGSKKQAEAFAKLGIDIRAFVASGKDAGDLMPLIAEGLKGLASDSERAATLVDLFGRSGQKLAPLLSEGAQGVNGLRDAAQKLGIVLSDEQIQRADETADKISQLNMVLQAKLAGAVADNVDSIMALVNALVALIDKTGAAIRAWQNWRKEVANRQDQSIVDGWFTSPEQKRAAQARIDGRNSTSRVVMPAGRATTPSGQRPSSGFGAPLNVDPNKLPDPWSSGSGGSLLRNGGGSTQPMDPRFLQMGGGGSLLSMAAGIPVFLPAGVFDQLVGGAKDAEAALAKVAEREFEVMDATQQLKGRTKETAFAMQRDFVDAANGILGALERLQSGISGGGFLGILSGIIGLGLQLGSVGAFGSKVAGRINASGKLPAYASGTDWHPGGLALVGERGPEIVNLPRGSQVYPNGTGPAGGGLVQNITFSGVMTTDDFWARIEAGQRLAARAGAQGGMKLMQRARARSLA